MKEASLPCAFRRPCFGNELFSRGVTGGAFEVRKMKLTSYFTSCLLFCLGAVQIGAAQIAPVDETQKNTAALLAVERHWTEAEVHGDVAYVSQLLLPEYRSVNPDGAVHPKSAIIASAAKNRTSNKMARLVAAYTKTHPYGTLVAIQGSTAVVTFYDSKRGPQKGITSCDVFTYLNGRWHAIYSQHNAVKA